MHPPWSARRWKTSSAPQHSTRGRSHVDTFALRSICAGRAALPVRPKKRLRCACAEANRPVEEETTASECRTATRAGRRSRSPPYCELDHCPGWRDCQQERAGRMRSLREVAARLRTTYTGRERRIREKNSTAPGRPNTRDVQSSLRDVNGISQYRKPAELTDPSDQN